MNIAIFFVVVIAVILLGMKTKVNMGFYAFSAALILGVGMAGLSAKNVIALFPLSLFYNFFIASAFYGYASSNGTVEVLAKKLMYKFRNQTWMGPVILYLITLILGACGNGVTAILIGSPFAFGLVAESGMNPLVAVSAIFFGYCSAAMFPWTSTGGTNTGLMQTYIGESAGIAGAYISAILGLVFSVLAFVIICVLLKGFKSNSSSAKTEVPPDFNAIQKKTILTIIVAIVVLVIPTFIQMVAPNPITKWISGMFNMQMVWSVGVVVLGLMGCGDTRDVVSKRINWSTLILVCGMGTLFALAQSIGVIDALSNILSMVPAWLILPTLSLICAFLSFFISGLVIGPFFMPMAVTLADLVGCSPSLVGAVICFSALVSGISPVSSGGACALAACPNDDVLRNKLVKQMMVTAVVDTIAVFFYTLVVSLII